MSKCKACGAEIVWIRMQTGRSMPCDEGLVPYKQCENGKDTVITQNGEAIRCRLQFEGIPTGLARISHFSTCTQPERFRKREQKNDDP